jgi:hypothetical protein
MENFRRVASSLSNTLGRARFVPLDLEVNATNRGDSIRGILSIIDGLVFPWTPDDLQ